MKMGIFKVSNIILTVTDLEKAVAFYRDVLGMKVNAIIAGEFAFLNGGGVVLALREATDRPNPGLTEIVFEVDDVRTTYEELKSKGVVFPYQPRAVTGNETSELYATDFRDPDGHILSITSWIQEK